MVWRLQYLLVERETWAGEPINGVPKAGFSTEPPRFRHTLGALQK